MRYRPIQPTPRRPRAAQVKSVRVDYTPKPDGPAYVIEADRHGNWTVFLDGAAVKSGGMPQDYYGKPRFGSKHLEADAIEAAKAAIAQMQEG